MTQGNLTGRVGEPTIYSGFPSSIIPAFRSNQPVGTGTVSNLVRFGPPNSTIMSASGVTYAITISGTGPVQIVRATETGLERVAGETFTQPDSNVIIGAEGIRDGCALVQGERIALLMYRQGVPGINFSTNDAALLRVENGVSTLAARDGDPAPGFTGGMLDLYNNNSTTGGYSNIHSAPILTSAGRLYFFASVRPPTGTTNTNINGLWTQAPGEGVQPVALASSAPGARYRSIRDVTANDQNELAYVGVSGAQSVSTVYFRDAAGLETALSSPVGMTIGSLPIINNRHEILTPTISGTSALVITSPISQRIIAQTGTLVPGGNGLTISTISSSMADFRQYESFTRNRTNYAINNLGQVVFIATLSNGNTGLFAWDPDLGLITILRNGATIALPGEPIEIVSNFDWIGGSNGLNGRASGFNDLGQVAISANFASGRAAAFIFQIPAPTTALAFLLSGIMCVRRRR